MKKRICKKTRSHKDSGFMDYVMPFRKTLFFLLVSFAFTACNLELPDFLTGTVEEAILSCPEIKNGNSLLEEVDDKKEETSGKTESDLESNSSSNVQNKPPESSEENSSEKDLPVKDSAALEAEADVQKQEQASDVYTDKTENSTDNEKPSDKENLTESSETSPMENLKDELIYLETKERKWTILVYMAADNNLESAAVNDLNEMEMSALDTNEVTVLVLFDRNPGYDTSHENWNGTRLYKLESGKLGFQSDFISKRIACNPLGITSDSNTEVDMSSPYTLSQSIRFMYSEYPAQHYGFIMWGHGSGWRSGENEIQDSENAFSRAFAYDSTTGSYMTLPQLRQGMESGLNGRKFDFLGFDTCYGGEIEVAYELCNLSDVMAASEGLVASEGWNYTDLLNRFADAKEKTTEALSDAVFESYKNQYKNVNRSGIFIAKMENIPLYFTRFEEYAGKVSKYVIQNRKRDNLLNLIAGPKIEKYSYFLEGSDVYMDIHSFVEITSSLYGISDSNFLYAEKLAVQKSWASDRDFSGPGVFVNTLGSGNLFSVSHPVSYIKGASLDQIKFVVDSECYVPKKTVSESLLDVLFYK